MLRTRETDVYLAVLRRYPETDAVLISLPSTCGDGGPADGAPDALFRNFVEANGRNAKPVSLLALKASFVTTNVRRVDHYATLGIDIERMLAETPYVLPSRVGFGAGGAQALFCVEFKGQGAFVHLRKIGGEWRVVDIRTAWVA